MAVRPITRRLFFFGALAVAAANGRTGQARARQESVVRYTIEALPTLGDAPVGIAYAINNAGDSAGSSGERGAFVGNPVIWRPGKAKAAGAEGEFGAANDINTGRRAVGVGFPSQEDYTSAALVWMKGQATALPRLGGNQSAAFAINDENAIVGWSTIQDGDPSIHACHWSGSNVTDLAGLGGDSFATDVNIPGQIVGGAVSAPGVLGGLIVTPVKLTQVGAGHAVLWDGGEVKDLGTLGGDWSTALALNDGGQVVGCSHTARADAPSRGFLWENGAMTELEAPPTETFLAQYALDINNAGQIVGTGDMPGTSGAPYRTALLWENGTIINLEETIPADSQWRLTSAWGINDAGQIVGDGAYQGSFLPFILTPVTS